MTGGLIQLVAYGKEDLFLTRNPQITFFKVIYRRYSNFIREDVEQYFTLQPDFGGRYTAQIAHDGDLIDKMCLRVTLPEIPPFQIANGLDPLTKFAWTRRIGHALIKTVEIEINGKSIDRHFGEWLFLWSILTTINPDDMGLDKLIGNIPELYEPTNGKPEHTIYIPLYFWFCRTSGSALPLVAMQYSDVKINIELNTLDYCHIITPNQQIKCVDNLVNMKQYEYLIQKGPDGIERYGMFIDYDVIEKKLSYLSIGLNRLIGIPYDGDPTTLSPAVKQSILNGPNADKYLIRGVSSDFSIKPDIGAKSLTYFFRPLKNINIKECLLLVGYVVLDNDERFNFAQSKQDYLIEQLYQTPNIQITSVNSKVQLDIDQPCKLMVWLAQFAYIDEDNDHFNYTDTHIRKRPYDNYTNIDSSVSKIRMFNDVVIGEPVGKSLIEEETILLNSKVRLNKNIYQYYQDIQPYQHFDNHLPIGSGMYSYAIYPGDTQPSGTTNMSQIELIELLLKMNYQVSNNRKINFRHYGLCLGIWRVSNGLSATIFIR
jgi:hypothetical protein